MIARVAFWPIYFMTRVYVKVGRRESLHAQAAAIQRQADIATASDRRIRARHGM